MKQIDQFVNSIYAHLSGKEAKELKQEMRSHLLETVEELKAEGKSEQEAVSIALDRFGDEKQIAIGLLTMFQSQKKFAKRLLRSAMIFLLVGLVVSVTLFMGDKKYSETLDMMDNVTQSFQTKVEFTSEAKLALEEMIERNSKWFENISYFALLKVSEVDGKSTVEKVFTHGQENTGESGMMRVDYNGNVGTEWRAEWQYKTYSYLKYEFLYYIFFAISGVLFILWGAVRFYNRNRLKAFG
ncbi:permease prefix domain 1-containing protein [Sporosarcina sp. BP05]|uniref:permease prefix domain 1-containing protein n=1 Tax=Sporosarcina sp. BP05 TaxID=2758726 RepID=UPI0016496176|nr:permease prefix domain 1-containing protein [Sporosarcina sp. BP05]